MKKIFTIAGFALFLITGAVSAASDTDTHHKKAMDSHDNTMESRKHDSTARQPGIGDSNNLSGISRKDNPAEETEWSIITEEDIYGSF